MNLYNKKGEIFSVLLSMEGLAHCIVPKSLIVEDQKLFGPRQTNAL
jgi:hypothetical protein